MKTIKTLTINGTTYEFDDPNAAGQITEEGGVILTDIESAHIANYGAVATGEKGLRATDESGDSEYTDESDWRYNEAIGTGSMASGIGVAAYSRASKSLGYRTQTGYPPNAEEELKRPEAVSGAVLSVIMLPKPVESNPSYNPFYFIDKEENTPYAVCLYLYNEIIEWYGMYDLDASELSYGAFKLGLPNHAYDNTAADSAGDFTTAVSFLNEEGETLASYSKRTNRTNIEGITITGTVPQDTKQMRIQITNHMREDEYVDGSISFYLYPADNVGQAAVAIGADTAALGNHSLAGGFKSKAHKHASFAFGRGAEASQVGATAFGQNTTASGEDSFAIGQGCIAGGKASLAMGKDTKANNAYATAFGVGTTATREGSFVCGKYNAPNGVVLFAVGNGTAEKPANAFQVRGDTNEVKMNGTFTNNGKFIVDKNGNVTANGKLTFADVDKASANTLVTKATGQYELIEDITLEEAVASFERNTAPDGSAYNFTDVRIVVTAPAVEKANMLTLQAYKTLGGSQLLFLSINNALNTQAQTTIYKLYNDKGMLEYYGYTGRDSVSSANMLKRGYFWDEPWNNMVKFKLSASSIPAGTRIVIYAVRG